MISDGSAPRPLPAMPTTPERRLRVQLGAMRPTGAAAPCATAGGLLPPPPYDPAAPPAQHIIDARADASAEQIASWRRDGFVVILDFLGPAQLEHMRGALDTAVARDSQFPLATQADNTNDGSTDFYSSVFRQRLNLHQTSGAMREVVFEVGKVAGKLASQLNAHPQGYRLYLDQALVKEPWANATGWHIGVRDCPGIAPLPLHLPPVPAPVFRFQGRTVRLC